MRSFTSTFPVFTSGCERKEANEIRPRRIIMYVVAKEET